MIVFLQSKATDEDDYFYQSLLFIVEQNVSGAVGFISNRPYSRSLNELQEFSFLPSFPLYEGGPVDNEHLYFIHRRPNLIDEGKLVSEDVYFGGNFKQAANAIAKGILHPNDIRIFIGYCGWDRGELEEEIKAEEWKIIEMSLFV